MKKHPSSVKAKSAMSMVLLLALLAGGAIVLFQKPKVAEVNPFFPLVIDTQLTKKPVKRIRIECSTCNPPWFYDGPLVRWLDVPTKCLLDEGKARVVFKDGTEATGGLGGIICSPESVLKSAKLILTDNQLKYSIALDGGRLEFGATE